MVDNNPLLPETCGPGLIAFYEGLLKEPLPQRLKDLLSMLEEAAQANTEASTGPSDASSAQPQPHRSQLKAEE
jgi:hypothetical protein